MDFTKARAHSINQQRGEVMGLAPQLAMPYLIEPLYQVTIN
jgi:hypothetical protein